MQTGFQIQQQTGPGWREDPRGWRMDLQGHEDSLLSAVLFLFLARSVQGNPILWGEDALPARKAFPKCLGSMVWLGGIQIRESFALSKDPQPCQSCPHSEAAPVDLFHSSHRSFCNKGPSNPARQNLALFFSIFPHGLLISAETKQRCASSLPIIREE